MLFRSSALMPGGNNYYNLLPQNLYGLQWWGDVCINADIEEVKTIQPANGKENVLITLQEVNELLANKKTKTEKKEEGWGGGEGRRGRM